MSSYKIFLPKGTKTCPLHTDLRVWLHAPFETPPFPFNSKQIEDMIDLLCSKKSMNLVEPFSSDVKKTTGLTADNFNDLLSRFPSLRVKYSSIEKCKSVLSIYLYKLRTGNTNIGVASFFQRSEKTIASKIAEARLCILKDFVPVHLYARSRQNLIEHTTKISQQLYSVDHDMVALVWDGTYIYIEKSANREFQRLSYSTQKHRNLVKIMMCVTTDGTIAGVYGPYSATENDAKILHNILVDDQEIFMSLELNDVMIVDRGFRDVVPELRDRGFIVKIPNFLKKNVNQFTDMEANESRLVTKTRFVVEARNGHMKSIWKYFSGVKITQSMPHLMDDFKIGAALINAYFPVIQTDVHMNDIGAIMLSRRDDKNELHSIVNSITVNSNTFTPVNFDELASLPRLTEIDLRLISLGSYQIKNAPGYCQSQLKNNNNQFELFKCNELLLQNRFGRFVNPDNDPILLLGQMASRFSNRKHHRTFVMFDKKGSGTNALIAYTCTCKNGLRTIGCCSHTMAVVWYVCHIDMQNWKQPAQFLDRIMVTKKQEELSDQDSE